MRITGVVLLCSSTRLLGTGEIILTRIFSPALRTWSNQATPGHIPVVYKSWLVSRRHDLVKWRVDAVACANHRSSEIQIQIEKSEMETSERVSHGSISNIYGCTLPCPSDGAFRRRNLLDNLQYPGQVRATTLFSSLTRSPPCKLTMSNTLPALRLTVRPIPRSAF